MTRQPIIARRAEALLGTAVVATALVAGGDIATATRLRLSDGTNAFMKTLPHPPSGFFDAEARGLRWIAEADSVAVPEVLGSDSDCVILRWVEPGKATQEAASHFGTALCRLHLTGADAFGWDADGFIGRLPLPNRATASWPEFFATKRVLPYLKLARDRGHATAEHQAAIEPLLGRLGTLVPDELPARLHGDLWNGNVIWGQDGTIRVIDPAAHGGHRETDLAMLALFGLPHLGTVLDAYEDTASAAGRPLADGWRDRLGIHQLFPLLTHAAMFGGGYASRAAALAASF
jgi:fructosamine-3-kinase